MNLESKSNEEVEKGQEGRDKSQNWTKQKRGLKWILDERAGRRLTVAGSCTVSAPAGNPFGLLAPLSGSEFQLLLNGARLAPLSRCSPAGPTDKDTQNDDKMIKQQKQLQIQMQMHISLTKT